MPDITERFLMIYRDLETLKKVSSPSDFAKKVGISPSMMNEILKNRSKVGIKVIQNTVITFEGYNLEWLIKGEGKMRKKFEVPELHYDPDEEYLLKLHGTPLLSLEAAAGFGNSNFLIKEEDIQGLYIVPDFSDIDFMIRVKGSSMYPKYSSGDVVACRIIRELKFIQWNKTYVIATKEQGILCKRLLPSKVKSNIQAVSDNKEYPPFDIPKDEITGYALIVGVIRLE